MPTPRSRNVDVATSSKPTRNRSAIKPAETAVSTEMVDLARTVYQQNLISNAAKASSEKAKKSLNILMAEDGAPKNFELTVDGVAVEAVIEATVGNVVDVAKLRESVTTEQFMQIVSATQDAVKNIVGGNVLMKCLKEVKGEPSLKVRKKK